MAKKIEKAAAKSAPKKVVKKVVGKKKPSNIQLLSYSIKAVIPTQQFGNIQPEIVVKASTIEDARAFAEPILEEIYQKYAEATPDGRTPKFFKKPEVVVTEKIIKGEVLPHVSEQKMPAKPDPMTVTGSEVYPDSEGVRKGKSMVSGATSREALDLIEQKVATSKNLKADEKDILYTLILAKRKEF